MYTGDLIATFIMIGSLGYGLGYVAGKSGGLMYLFDIEPETRILFYRFIKQVMDSFFGNESGKQKKTSHGQDEKSNS